MFTEFAVDNRRWHVFLRDAHRAHEELTDCRHIRLVVGSCLFGSAGAEFVGPDGLEGCPDTAGLELTEVRAIRVNRQLGLYEHEAIRRSARFVRELLAVVPRNVPVTVVMDIPKLQYHAYLLNAYARHTVARHLLRQWWNEVDQRHCQVIDELRDQLRRSATLADRPDVHIAASRGLNDVQDMPRTAIAHGWPAGYGAQPEERLIHDMVDALQRSTVGHEWTTLLRHMEVPGTLGDLALASYTWQLSRPQLHHVRGTAPVVTVMVDDIAEHKTYTAARQVSASISADRHSGTRHPLMAAFPLRRLFYADRTGTHSLYHDVRADRFRTSDGQVLTGCQLATEVTRPCGN